MKRFALGMSFAGLLGGCVTAHKPPTSGPTATIAIEVPATSMFRITQDISIVKDEQCKEPARLAMFNPLPPYDTVRQVIPAERRVFIGASINKAPMSQTNPGRWCAQLLSFVPRNGESYKFKQVFTEESCFTQILQESDSQTPPTLMFHSAKACR